MPNQSKTRRSHDSEASRAAIIEAARACFTQASFDQVSVRTIAERADVNAALVIRYFGSKEALFEKAVTQDFDLSALLTFERSKLGEGLARYVLAKKPVEGEFDALIALLRSSPNSQAAALLRRVIDAQFVKPLTAWLGGERATERAGLIAAYLLGILVARNVVGSVSLTSKNDEALVALVASTLQAYVDEPPLR